MIATDRDLESEAGRKEGVGDRSRGMVNGPVMISVSSGFLVSTIFITKPACWRLYFERISDHEAAEMTVPFTTAHW